MSRYGMALYVLVWHSMAGMAWYGMAWDGMLWHGTSMAQYGMIWNCMLWYGMGHGMVCYVLDMFQLWFRYILMMF